MGMDLVVDIFFTIKLIKGAIFASPSCEHLPYISFQFTYDFYPSKQILNLGGQALAQVLVEKDSTKYGRGSSVNCEQLERPVLAGRHQFHIEAVPLAILQVTTF